MKKIETLGKALNKAEQKEIFGGNFPTPTTNDECVGTGTGGVITEGFSTACIGREHRENCLINGYLAACTGSGGGFWFY